MKESQKRVNKIKRNREPGTSEYGEWEKLSLHIAHKELYSPFLLDSSNADSHTCTHTVLG
jgi:hypothetical protein